MSLGLGSVPVQNTVHENRELHFPGQDLPLPNSQSSIKVGHSTAVAAGTKVSQVRAEPVEDQSRCVSIACACGELS